jgi:hypothetical protein
VREDNRCCSHEAERYQDGPRKRIYRILRDIAAPRRIPKLDTA